MAISYGSSAGFSKSTSKTLEYLAVQDNNGAVAENILKFSRTETTTETVSSTFGAPLLDGEEVISASITWSVDETIIDPSTSSTAPPQARSYNPRAEASVTVLGEMTPSDFELDGTTFDTLSAEKAETAGDVKKTNLRGVYYGTGGSLTVGNIAGGGTIRKEKRFSNTDFVREITTTVAFGGS
jgi:hypothetical protein